MKKKLFALLLATLLLLSVSVPAFADGAWEVIYDGSKTLKGQPGVEFTQSLQDIEAGDEATFEVTVKNKGSRTVDWYMLNIIKQTLEETNGATDGGYTYILSYQPSSGSTRELYNSNRVGGGGQAGYTNPTEEGLKEINDALKDYMFLERMAPGKEGKLTLTVALDGESMINSYQAAVAKLQLLFAVEEVETNVVVTGDNPVKLSPAYIGMGISGVVVLLLAIDGAVRNARKRKEPKA